jgi:murein DD-endopeptidase MepM/ murein hydrolase activator NlpD
MLYPYAVQPFLQPLFKEHLKGNGVFISLANNSPVYENVDIRDQIQLQEYADQLMRENKTNWAVSDFGENREFMFTELGHDQMVSQQRFMHLGLDIWVPVNTPIYAPLTGEVVLSEYESGEGNYGGLVIMKHKFNDLVIYAVYGHLAKDQLPAVNTVIATGEKIGLIGEMDSNGGYFYHTHLQVLTEAGYQNGFAHKGYSTPEQFQNHQEFCLDPRFLFKL